MPEKIDGKFATTYPADKLVVMAKGSGKTAKKASKELHRRGYYRNRIEQ